VLWILALLSVVVLSWAQEWRAEIRLAANFREARQCRSLAEAGINYALAKVTEAKLAEIQSGATQLQTPAQPQPWGGDQRSHLLELPGGQVVVRVEDEAGKINLNRAEGKRLANLFIALGIPDAKWRVMVDSIEDWRQPGPQPRPFGALSNYYLGLEPPYPAKGGAFDTVEELAWVRGFDGSNLPVRLAAYLTVQGMSHQINLNAAPLEVLLGLGLPLDLAQTLVQERQVAPLRPQEVMPRLATDQQLLPLLQSLSFKSSPFFTILATGMINNKGGARYTIKAMVRLSQQGDPPWRVIYWADDYPG
jgi:general secretion pathway protein K